MGISRGESQRITYAIFGMALVSSFLGHFDMAILLGILSAVYGVISDSV